MHNFNDFDTIRSLGTLCWDSSDLSQKRFKEVTVEDVLKGLRHEKTLPSRIVQPTTRLPVTFGQLAPQKVLNMFPVDNGAIVPLYVAKQRGVDLESVDFLLGGSVLNVFANKEVERQGDGADLKYLVQKCRHLHLMLIAGYTVLFSAEVDAVDDAGVPVEIKSGNPRWFGMKVMFQMLSSSARTLVMADRRGPQLQRIQRKTFEDMVGEHPMTRLRDANNAIVEALIELKHSPIVTDEDPVEVDFERGQMVLKPCHRADLLPSAEVVKELLAD